MFRDLLNRLLSPVDTPLTDKDARLALCALLVRVARSDNHYADSEIQRINRVLQTRYGLDAEGAAALRQDGETLEQEAPDTVRFTRAIKDAVPYADRTAVIIALWQIALADGARGDEEDSLLRLVAKLLGVNDVDNAAARRRAEQA